MNGHEMPDWPRKYFEHGGGNPYLFYVVFGASAESVAISRREYHCDGLPEGLELLSYDQGSHFEVLDQFRNGPHWAALQKSDPALCETIAAQQQCVIIRGAPSDTSSLNYLRDTIGVITYLLDHGGVGVLDLQCLKWWSSRYWRDELFDRVELLPCQHVVILVSSELDGEHWYHTRGMRKFGRPDLSMHNVMPGYAGPVLEMFNRFIEFQAFGGIIREEREIKMPSLPDGLHCVHRGDEDDPDFNNVHVEVHWPRTAK